jgi:hypothetical protein
MPNDIYDAITRIAGKVVTAKTDKYSIVVILYEMCKEVQRLEDKNRELEEQIHNQHEYN